jgi:LPXTG-motif cell wall-anchored protein
MERTGVCMGCHQNMADENFWTDEVIAKFGTVASTDEHIDAMNEVLQASVAEPEVVAEAPAASGPSEADLKAAEAKAAEAEAAQKEAEAKAQEAEAKIQEAEAKAAEAEAMAKEAETAAAEAPPPSTGMNVWSILALVLGLVVGAGAVWFLRKK